MDLLQVFAVGFEIGILTGLPVILWRRDTRRHDSQSRAAELHPPPDVLSEARLRRAHAALGR